MHKMQHIILYMCSDIGGRIEYTAYESYILYKQNKPPGLKTKNKIDIIVNNNYPSLVLTCLQFAASQFGKYHNIAVQPPKTSSLDLES